MSAVLMTKDELAQLIREEVRAALKLYNACAPPPATVSIEEAARMLGVSRRTLQRMRLPRVGRSSMIPYQAVLDCLASK